MCNVAVHMSTVPVAGNGGRAACALGYPSLPARALGAARDAWPGAILLQRPALGTLAPAPPTIVCAAPPPAALLAPAMPLPALARPMPARCWARAVIPNARTHPRGSPKSLPQWQVWHNVAFRAKEPRDTVERVMKAFWLEVESQVRSGRECRVGAGCIISGHQAWNPEDLKLGIRCLEGALVRPASEYWRKGVIRGISSASGLRS